jgi:hypothetical protein
MPPLVKAALETLSLASTAGQLSGQPPPMIARRECGSRLSDKDEGYSRSVQHMWFSYCIASTT